jgi:hypothetical protein
MRLFNFAFAKTLIVVPEGFSPSTLLDIKYPSGEDVALGNFIKPEDSAQQPTVNFIPDDETAHYTLVLVRPFLQRKQQ